MTSNYYTDITLQDYDAWWSIHEKQQENRKKSFNIRIKFNTLQDFYFDGAYEL